MARQMRCSLLQAAAFVTKTCMRASPNAQRAFTLPPRPYPCHTTHCSNLAGQAVTIDGTELEAMLRYLKGLKHLILPGSARVDLTAPGMKALFEEQAGWSGGDQISPHARLCANLMQLALIGQAREAGIEPAAAASASPLPARPPGNASSWARRSWPAWFMPNRLDESPRQPLAA